MVEFLVLHAGKHEGKCWNSLCQSSWK